MTKAEIAAELNAIQATIDALLDRLVAVEKPKKKNKATVRKRR